MPTPRGDLIFVPLIGSQPVEDWTTVPHIKCWGLWDGEHLHVLHLENGGAESLHAPVTLFDAEVTHIKTIEHGVDEVPEQVSVELARIALQPVRED